MAEKENILKDISEKYPGSTRDTLIPLLQDIQDKYGYINRESILALSEKFKLPTSKIYGLATFYNQFRLHPRGEYHIQVCNGSACHLTLSKKIINEIQKELNIKDGETSRDKKFSLEILPCIGACGQSPVICINDEYYTKLTVARLREILTTYREK